MAKKVAKKKTTKKKVTKKTTAKKAGAARPSYRVDTAANRKQTKRKSKWLGKLDVGNTMMRFIPPMGGSNVLTPLTALHYKLKRADDPTKNIAPGCLEVHGDGNCYICNFIEFCANSGDHIMQAIADDLTATEQCRAQVFVFDKIAKEWTGPMIFNLPGGITKEIEALLSMSEDAGTPQFCDPYVGQSLMINREGTGRYDTRYKANLVGDISDLEDVIPGWEKKAFSNLWKALEVKVLDINEQKERLVATFPDLPWEDIEEAIG